MDAPDPKNTTKADLVKHYEAEMADYMNLVSQLRSTIHSAGNMLEHKGNEVEDQAAVIESYTAEKKQYRDDIGKLEALLASERIRSETFRTLAVDLAKATAEGFAKGARDDVF